MKSLVTFGDMPRSSESGGFRKGLSVKSWRVFHEDDYGAAKGRRDREMTLPRALLLYSPDLEGLRPTPTPTQNPRLAAPRLRDVGGTAVLLDGENQEENHT